MTSQLDCFYNDYVHINIMDIQSEVGLHKQGKLHNCTCFFFFCSAFELRLRKLISFYFLVLQCYQCFHAYSLNLEFQSLLFDELMF